MRKYEYNTHWGTLCIFVDMLFIVKNTQTTKYILCAKNWQQKIACIALGPSLKLRASESRCYECIEIWSIREAATFTVSTRFIDVPKSFSGLHVDHRWNL